MLAGNIGSLAGASSGGYGGASLSAAGGGGLGGSSSFAVSRRWEGACGQRDGASLRQHPNIAHHACVAPMAHLHLPATLLQDRLL